jgi:hypothetical protein
VPVTAGTNTISVEAVNVSGTEAIVYNGLLTVTS